MKTVAEVSCTRILDGQAAVIEFGPMPANIVDRATMNGIVAALRECAADKSLKCIIVRGEGNHFSYGASVPEHVPGEFEKMIPEFHAALRAFNAEDLPPVIAAVRGRCLGGGFELAMVCDLIAVDPAAQLGCPEVMLGVFPPAGAALLPLRATAGRSAGMLMTGRIITGSEAFRLGIADIEAPSGQLDQAVEAWITDHLSNLSAEALRQTRRATRHPWRKALGETLVELEKQYLQDLMSTEDAVEGLQSFLEKRRPEWKNR
jgi:cyclohexa-1,5-dienecarbonyl-CoA hydratase